MTSTDSPDSGPTLVPGLIPGVSDSVETLQKLNGITFIRFLQSVLIPVSKRACVSVCVCVCVRVRVCVCVCVFQAHPIAKLTHC